MFWNKYTVGSDFETKTDLAWICQERKRVLTVWKPRKSLTQGQQVQKKHSYNQIETFLELAFQVDQTWMLKPHANLSCKQKKTKFRKKLTRN